MCKSSTEIVEKNSEDNDIYVQKSHMISPIKTSEIKGEQIYNITKTSSSIEFTEFDCQHPNKYSCHHGHITSMQLLH